MENPYHYRPKRPTPLSIFIIVAMLINAFLVIKAIIGGIDVVSAFIVVTQVYGLIKLWKLEESGVYLWLIPQSIVLIRLAQASPALPFIIEAIFTVIFIYCIGLVWNSLWPSHFGSKDS
jgi:hypothetical protein